MKSKLYIAIIIHFSLIAFVSQSQTIPTPLKSAPAIEKTDGFTHGPQLGNVTSKSIRVWTRTKQPGSFNVIYSTKPDLSDALTSKSVQTNWLLNYYKNSPSLP